MSGPVVGGRSLTSAIGARRRAHLWVPLTCPWLFAVLALAAVPSPARAAPVVVGAGEEPSVAVDDSAAAHIVFNPARGRSVRYCRLPRGATRCETRRRLRFAGRSAFFVRPLILRTGPARLRVLSARERRGGRDEVWTRALSGTGTNLGAATRTGGFRADWTFAGSPAALDVAGAAWLVGSDDTGVGRVQRIALSPPRRNAELARLGFNDGQDISVAVPADGRPIVAVTLEPARPGLASRERVAFRRLMAPGLPNRAASWSPWTTIAEGANVRLAGGATGTFLLYQKLPGFPPRPRGLYLRAYRDGVFDAPVAVAPASEKVQDSDVAVDGSGRVHVVWATNRRVRYAASAPGGGLFGPVIELARREVYSVRLAVAPAGGGAAVFAEVDTERVGAIPLPGTS